MQGFITEEMGNFFLTDAVPVVKPTVTPITVEDRKNNLEYTTGLTRGQIDKVTNEFGTPTQPLTYKNVGISGLQTSLDMGASLPELQDSANKDAAVSKALKDMAIISGVSAATASDPLVGSTLWQSNKRLEGLRDRVYDHISASSGGVVDTTVEVADSIAYSIYQEFANFSQGITGGGTEVGRQSVSIAQAALSMDDLQWANYEEQIFEEMKTKGLAADLGATSAWAGGELLTAINGGGAIVHDQAWGVVSSVLAPLDLVGGIGAISKGAKVVGKVAGATEAVAKVKNLSGIVMGAGVADKIAAGSRSVVGALRNAGTLVATKAAEGSDVVLQAIKGGDKTIVTDALLGRSKLPKLGTAVDTIESLAPEAYASTLKSIETPAVSFSSIYKHINENKFIQRLLNKEAKFGFGAAEIGPKAKVWAMDQAAKLAEASSTKMINFEFVDEGLQNFRTSVTFGTDGGVPFKTYKAAEKALSGVKDSNAIIIDTRTNLQVFKGTKSGQYAIKTDTRVPYSSVAEPMDISHHLVRTTIKNVLSKVQTSRIGRFLSSANYGTSTILSNLADAAEFGFMGYSKEIDFAFKAINKLPKDSIEKMNSILTTLRDTPIEGSSKSWLTPNTFIKHYSLINNGVPPTLEVLKAYEHIVEMSDLSWFVMASDRLKAMASHGASIVPIDGMDTVVYSTEKTVAALKAAGKETWVKDLSTGEKVALSTIDDNQALMIMDSRQMDSTNYIINFEGKTQLPKLEHAYPYNAGGPRSNPDIQYFIGDTSNGWSTLIGARTEKEATVAVKQYNKIAAAIRDVFKGKVTPTNILAAVSKEDKLKLDNIIFANTDWHKGISDLETFLDFTSKRGVNPMKDLFSKSRDLKIGSFSSFAEDINDKHLLDMSVETYSSYKRHDIALVEFGGEKTSNPDPIIAVANQFQQLTTRAAQTQYRMEATSSWVKAVEDAIKSGAIDRPDIPMNPMTDEMKVLNYKIVGNKASAVALRKEQNVIQRRLRMYKGLFGEINGLSSISQSVFEDIYNSNKKLGGAFKWISEKFSKSPQGIKSLGFYTKMADPSQAIIQASHIISITAISPKNGSIGVSLAGFIRQAAREGDATWWASIEANIAKYLGVTPEVNKALMDHLVTSGRGYMRGAFIEDTDVISPIKNVLGKVGAVARAPFYAGENFQATVSRITAFLDIHKANPEIAVDSAEFWNKVQARDRTISFAMNNANKSIAASGPISSVLIQWTSQPINAIQTMLFSDLTAIEKARLGGVTLSMWGLAGIGAYGLGAKLTEGYPDWMRELVINGLGDTVLEETLGIKLGTRLGTNFVSLRERAVQTFMDPFGTIPGARIASDTASSAVNALLHFGSGRWDMGSHDLSTFIRSWKVVDNAVMAHSMLMNDVRISNSGTPVEGPFTTTEAFFQAIGVSPAKVINLQNIKTLTFDLSKKQALAVKSTLGYTKEALNQIKQGNYAAGSQMLYEVDHELQSWGLTGTALRETTDELLGKAGADFTESELKALITAGLLDQASDLKDLKE